MATRILVLATKNENLGASWPQDFFLKVEHCRERSYSNQTFGVVAIQNHAHSTTDIKHTLHTFYYWHYKLSPWGIKLRKSFSLTGNCLSQLHVHVCTLYQSNLSFNHPSPSPRHNPGYDTSAVPERRELILIISQPFKLLASQLLVNN